MAEETAPETKEAKKGSPLVKNIILGVAAVIVPAIIALVVFLFVLKPMLAAPGADGHGETKVEEEKESEEGLSPEVEVMEFQESQATLVPPSPDAGAPVLTYQVAFTCKNHETAVLIEEKKPLFVAMIAKFHRNRTRTELNDPYVQDTLLKQIKEGANTLLKQLAEKKNNVAVVDAIYVKFAIFDL